MKLKYWSHAALAGLFCATLTANAATGGPEQGTLGDILWEHEVTLHHVPEDAQA